MLNPGRWLAHKVVVASMDFTGTGNTSPEYDYRCDRENDEREICSAIEYVYHLWGGGIVQLTSGRFDSDIEAIQEALKRCPNVTIQGC